MSQNTVIVILLLYIISREVFFLYSTNKLVNKIMSNSFYDYQQSLKVVRKEKKEPTQAPDEDLTEDLGIMRGIGL